jgi:FKBP-type peptidyl-prolyl cis-trans isomerase FklB
MKKFILIVMACLFTATAVFAAKGPQKPKKVKMKDQTDTISYSIGVAVGRDLRKQLVQTMDGKQNTKLLLDGLTSAINGDTTCISPVLADTLVQKYMKAVFEKKEKIRIEKNVAFLKENAKKPGIITLPSGLQYQVLTPGTGEHPADSSTVKVHYEGSLIDGTVFDSSIKRGQPVELALNRVIKGWSEGVLQMAVGAKYKLFVPAELGYGAQQVGPIPPNSTLIFEVQLLEIVKQKK